MTASNQKLREMNILKARQLCSDTLALEGVRLVFDLLSQVDVTWHPDDDVTDINWEFEMSDDNIARLVWIDNALIEATSRLDMDIYEECMQSHVRMHGEKSCFWPEHIAYGERAYLCTWEGYGPDEETGKIAYAEHALGWFTEELGYEDTDRDMLASLSIADTHTMLGHTVMRIK